MKSQVKFRKLIPYVAILVLLPSVRGRAGGQGEQTLKPDTALSPLQPPAADMNGEKVLAGLVEHSRLRDRLLDRYSAARTYKLGNTKGKVYAQAVVEVQYRAPGGKTFTTESEHGGHLSKWILHKLIGAEAETSSGKQHRDSSISPHNYSFQLLGDQQAGPYHCYVVEATPRRKDKYLFSGRIWISQPDFGIVKISGEPANKISFWIEHVHFVRQYEQIGLFWLPQKDSTVAKVRFSGRKTFSIVHYDYSINGVSSEQIRAEMSPLTTRGIQPLPGNPSQDLEGLRLSGIAPGPVVARPAQLGEGK